VVGELVGNGFDGSWMVNPAWEKARICEMSYDDVLGWVPTGRRYDTSREDEPIRVFVQRSLTAQGAGD
jgi:hypothetical protein